MIPGPWEDRVWYRCPTYGWAFHSLCTLTSFGSFKCSMSMRKRSSFDEGCCLSYLFYCRDKTPWPKSTWIRKHLKSSSQTKHKPLSISFLHWNLKGTTTPSLEHTGGYTASGHLYLAFRWQLLFTQWGLKSRLCHSVRDWGGWAKVQPSCPHNLSTGWTKSSHPCLPNGT